MALFSFFKSYKNQNFLYIPRYWDPKKEQKQERINELKSQKDDSTEAIKDRLTKRGFRGGYTNDTSFRKKKVTQSNMMLLAVLAVLIILVLYFLNVYLPKIVETLEGSSSVVN